MQEVYLHGLIRMDRGLMDTYTLQMRQLEIWNNTPPLHLGKEDQSVIQLPKSSS